MTPAEVACLLAMVNLARKLQAHPKTAIEVSLAQGELLLAYDKLERENNTGRGNFLEQIP
jgi:hypothetical protein